MFLYAMLVHRRELETFKLEQTEMEKKTQNQNLLLKHSRVL